MPRNLRVLFLALTVLCLTLLLATWSAGSALPQIIRRTVSRELSRNLNTSVRLGAARLRGLTSIGLEDISVEGRGGNGAGKPFLKAPEIRVGFNPVRYLFSPRRPLDAVRTITLNDAEINAVQADDGSWNIPELSAAVETSGSGPSYGFVLRGGRLSIRPGAGGGVRSQPVDISLHRGDIRIKGSDVGLSFRGDLADGSGTITGKGEYGRDGLKIELSSPGIKHVYWGPRLQKIASLNTMDGVLSGKATLTSGRDGWSVDEGEMRIRNLVISPGGNYASLSSPDIMFRLVGQDMVIPGSAVYWNGQKGLFSGRITDYMDRPVLDLQSRPARVELRRLGEAAGSAFKDIAGSADLTVRLRGRPGNIRLDGEIQSKAIELYGRGLMKVKADIEASSSGLQLRGGAVWAGADVKGSISIDDGGTSCEARITDLLPSQVSELREAGLGDSGGIDIQVKGRAAAGGASIEGRFVGRPGRLAGVRYETASGSFSSGADGLRLESVVLGTEFGNLTGEATLAKGSYEVLLNGRGLTLGDIAGFDDLRGDLRASLKGALQEAEKGVTFDGSFEVNDGRAGQLPLSGLSLRGGGLLRRGGAEELRLAVEHSGARAGISGSVGQDGRLSVRAKDIDAELLYLLQAAGVGSTAVSGHVEGDAALSGSLSKPVLNLALSGADVSFGGKTAGLRLEMTVGDGALQVKQASIGGEAGKMDIVGSLAGKKGNVTIHGRNVTSELVSALSGETAVPEGFYDLDATLRGGLDAPRLEAVVKGREIIYQGRAFPSMGLSLAYEDKMLKLQEIELTHASGSFSGRNLTVPAAFSGGRLLFDGGLAGEFEASIRDASSLGLHIPGLDIGAMGMMGNLSGSISSPRIRGRLNVAGAEMTEFGLKITELQSDLQADKDGISIDGLKARLGTAAIGGHVRVGLRDWRPRTIEGDVQAAGGRLEDLAAAGFPQVSQMSGRYEGMLLLNGDFASPEITAAARLMDAEISYAPLKTPVTDVNATLALRSGKLEISSFKGKMGQGEVNVSGIVGLPGSGKSLDLAITSDKAEVEYPPYFKGIVDSSVTVKGLPASPLIEGSIFVSHSRLSLGDLGLKGDGLFSPQLNIKSTLGRGVDIILSRVSAPVRGGVEISGTLHDLKLVPQGMVLDFGLFKFPIKSIPLPQAS